MPRFPSYIKSPPSTLPKDPKQPKPMNKAGIYYSNTTLLTICKTFSTQTSRIPYLTS